MSMTGPTAAQSLEQITGACGGAMPLPPRGDEQVFAAPWQAQVFAMTIALYDRGVMSWPEWAEILGEHVRDGTDDGSDYYERWADALLDLLARKQIASVSEIDELTAAWHAAAARTPHGQPIEL